jgi:hypothetical protein
MENYNFRYGQSVEKVHIYGANIAAAYKMVMENYTFFFHPLFNVVHFAKKKKDVKT